MHFSHFFMMVAFGLLVSVALGCLTQQTSVRRIKYAAWTFALFLAVGLGIAWLMYPFSR
ncbi:MAG: hypothetical protein ACRD3S_19300 [Terracidiphilus sp.]